MEIPKEIREEWGKDGFFIESYYASSPEIRFLIRDNKQILQYKAKVNVEFNKPLFRAFMGDIRSEVKFIWLDVPVEMECKENE